MWWIGTALLIQAVGFLLGWGLLLTAAPKSERELCYEDEAEVRALANWRASGGRGWLATESPKQDSSKPPRPLQDIGQLVDPSTAKG